MSVPTVATPNPGHTEMLLRWEKILDLKAGTKRMTTKEIWNKYVPKGSYEDDNDYDERRKLAVLFNVVRWSIQLLSSRPVSKDIAFSAETSPELIKFSNDVTGTGVTLRHFARQLLDDCQTYGKSHFIVEYPETGAELSVADEQAEEIRPYFVRIDPLLLFAWKIARQGALEKVDQIRIRETVTDDANEWGGTVVEQIRVIDLDSIRIYRLDGKTKKWSQHGATILLNTPFDQVPIATAYAKRGRKPFLCDPPLEDLADLNLQHFNKQADLDSYEWMMGKPILFGKKLKARSSADGKSDGQVTIALGSKAMVHSDNADSDLKFIELTGNSIPNLKLSIEALETKMAAMTSDLLLKRTGGITATQRALDEAASISDLQATAKSVEESLEEGLIFAGKWMDPNKNWIADISLYTNFSDMLSTSDVDTLLKLKDGGVIPKSVVFSEAQRRGIITDDLTAKKVEELMATEQQDG